MRDQFETSLRRNGGGCSSVRTFLQVAEDGSALVIPFNATTSNQVQRSCVFPCLGLPRMHFPLIHSSGIQPEHWHSTARSSRGVRCTWGCHASSRRSRLPPTAWGRASPSPLHACVPLNRRNWVRRYLALRPPLLPERCRLFLTAVFCVALQGRTWQALFNEPRAGNFG